MLEVNQVEFSYGEETVLKGLSFDLDCGAMIGIIGPNGSGKTTLVKCLNGLVQPDAGEVVFQGRNLANFPRRKIARTIGYVPQAENQTFPYTVFDAVLTGRAAHSRWKPSEEDLTAVASTLANMGLDDLAMRDVGALSGGQLRKVLIARAFAQEPKLLSLDEPMASLDLRHQLEVLNTVQDWLTEDRAAVITFHDLNLAAKYCNELVIIKEGEIFARGGPEILTPKNIEPVYDIEVEVNQNRSTRWIEPKRPLT